MNIICLMGKDVSVLSNVRGVLNKLGYKDMHNYTYVRDYANSGTRLKYMDKPVIERLLQRNIANEYIQNGIRVAFIKPVGEKKSVTIVEEQGYKALKQLYGSQVTGVYIASSINEVENTEDIENTDEYSYDVDADIFIGFSTDPYTIAACILKGISSKVAV